MVFEAIHAGDPDEKLLAYQYLQTLPKVAESASSKLWIIPSELTEALKGIGRGFGGVGSETTSDRSGNDQPRSKTPRTRGGAVSTAADAAVAAAREAASAADDIASEAARTRPTAGDTGI